MLANKKLQINICVEESKLLVTRVGSFLRYYFPTYENDALLCTLSDSDDGCEDSHSKDVPVIAEDVSELRTLKQTSILKQLLKNRNSCS